MYFISSDIIPPDIFSPDTSLQSLIIKAVYVAKLSKQFKKMLSQRQLESTQIQHFTAVLCHSHTQNFTSVLFHSHMRDTLQLSCLIHTYAALYRCQIHTYATLNRCLVSFTHLQHFTAVLSLTHTNTFWYVTTATCFEYFVGFYALPLYALSLYHFILCHCMLCHFIILSCHFMLCPCDCTACGENVLT